MPLLVTMKKMNKSTHCMKSVQIRSFVWSVFSYIQTEYGELLRKSPYSVQIQENTDQKKLRIWRLFTQWLSLGILLLFCWNKGTSRDILRIENSQNVISEEVKFLLSCKTKAINLRKVFALLYKHFLKIIRTYKTQMWQPTTMSLSLLSNANHFLVIALWKKYRKKKPTKLIHILMLICSTNFLLIFFLFICFSVFFKNRCKLSVPF